MKDSLKNHSVRWLASALLGAILLAQTPALALSGLNLRPAVSKKPVGPYQPAVMLHQDTLEQFEEVTGRQLSSSELSQIQKMMDVTTDLNRSEEGLVQKVRWDLGNSGYEFTLLICGQFKLQPDAIMPQKARDMLMKLGPAVRDRFNGALARGTIDLVPCFDPHTGMSYVMAGGGQNYGTATVLTGGLSVGLYFSPKSDKLIVGSYVFGRSTWNIGALGRWDLTAGGDLRCLNDAVNIVTEFQFSLSNCANPKFFISTGLGIDLGGALISKLKKIKKLSDKLPATPNGNANGKTVDLGLWEFSWGVIVNVHEFPWYERMRGGQSLTQAFSDMAQYIAANNR